MTYWEQECGEKLLHVRLKEIISNDDIEIIDDEKELFRALKRHLTRKELHAFCMIEGSCSEEDVSQRVSVKVEDVKVLIKKACRKIKQAKVTNEIILRDSK